jgi:hypothetical protein
LIGGFRPDDEHDAGNGISLARSRAVCAGSSQRQCPTPQPGTAGDVPPQNSKNSDEGETFSPAGPRKSKSRKHYRAPLKVREKFFSFLENLS